MVGREDVKGEKVWVSGLNSGESVFAPFCVRVGNRGPHLTGSKGEGWLVFFSSLFSLLLITFLFPCDLDNSDLGSFPLAI